MLRELSFGIGFDIELGLLEEADGLVDDLKENVLSSTDSIEELGIAGEEAGSLLQDSFELASSGADDLGMAASGAMDDIAGSSADAASGVSDLGREASRAGREGSSSLRGMGDTLDYLKGNIGEVLGVIKTGLAGLAATGFTGKIIDMASNIETLEIRLRHAAETEEEWSNFNETMNRVVETTRGMIRGGDWMAAAQQAERMGISLESFSSLGEQAMITVIGKGGDFDTTMKMITETIETGRFSVRGFAREVGINLDQALKDAGITSQVFRDEWSASRREMFLNDLLTQQATENMGLFDDIVNSTAGSSQAFKGALGDLGEVMGGPLLKPMTRIFQTLTTIFDTIQSNPVGKGLLEFLGWAIAIGGVVLAMAGLKSAAGLLLPIVKAMLLPLLKFVAIGAAIYLVVEDLIYAFGGFGDSVTEGIFDAVMGFLGFDITFQEFREGLIAGLKLLGDWFVGIWDVIVHAWQTGEGWLGGLLHGIVAMFQGTMIVLANIFKIGFGLVWGIFTGDWSILKDGFKGLLDGLGLIWDGIKMIVAAPLEWVTGKIVEWKDNALLKIDELVQGFLNLPGTIMDGLKSFGSNLYETITKPLEKVRRLLPFSPAKEGPLTDLHESGANIIGNIQEGIGLAKPLTIVGQVEPISDQIKNLEGSIGIEATDTSQFRETANQVRGAASLESSSVAARGEGSHSFSPTFHIKVEGGGQQNQDVAAKIRRELEFKLVPMMEEFFKRQQKLRPNLTER